MADSEPDQGYGYAVGASFIDKLLLVLIDANPDPDADKLSLLRAHKRREKRLAAAKDALFGADRPRGHPPNMVDVDRALRWMGQQRHDDRARSIMAQLPEPLRPRWASDPNYKIRSTRTLATEATKKFHIFGSDVSDSLRRKFADQEDYWVSVAHYHDDVPDQMEWNDIVNIAEILGKHGIRAKTMP